MRTFCGILACAAFVAIAASVASADTISFSHTTPSTAAPFTDTFTLSNFDTSLGTLTDVRVIFTYADSAEIDVGNTTGAARAFSNATAFLNVELTAPNLGLDVAITEGPLSNVAIPGLNVFTGLTGTGIIGLDIGLDLDSTYFPPYETPPGTGSSTYTMISSVPTFTGNAANGVFFFGSVSTGEVTTVTYTYTPSTATAVPLPASSAAGGAMLLALGLVAAARAKRRRTSCDRLTARISFRWKCGSYAHGIGLRGV